METINSDGVSPEDVGAQVKKLTGSKGAEAAVDAMGGTNATLTALQSLAKGGRLCVAGLTTQDNKGQLSIPIDQLVLSEWSLVGSLGDPHSEYPELLHIIDSGKLQPSKIIGEEVALKDVQSVFDRLPAFETEGFAVVTNFN